MDLETNEIKKQAKGEKRKFDFRRVGLRYEGSKMMKKKGREERTMDMRKDEGSRRSNEIHFLPR